MRPMWRNCGGVQQTEPYIGVVSVVQRPIEADRTCVVTLWNKTCEELSMKHSIMIGDRITDLIVTGIALGAVAAFAALGFMIALAI